MGKGKKQQPKKPQIPKEPQKAKDFAPISIPQEWFRVEFTSGGESRVNAEIAKVYIKKMAQQGKRSKFKKVEPI